MASQGKSGEASHGCSKTWHVDSKYGPSSSVGIVPASIQHAKLSSLGAANDTTPCQPPETEPAREGAVTRTGELRSYFPALPLMLFFL